MIVNSLTSLVFPHRCAGCEEWGELLCGSCHSKLHFLKVPAFLPRLSKQYFEVAYSSLAYENLAHDLIHQYKFKHKLYLTQTLANLLARVELLWEKYDGLVPVPLHWWRHIKRGFNPSHLLAYALGKKIKKPVLPLLKKIRSTKPQTKFSSEERLKNVQGVFICRKKKRRRIEDASFLLIDDVLTTGATTNECAKVLKKAGAKSVDVLTLARPL